MLRNGKMIILNHFCLFIEGKRAATSFLNTYLIEINIVLEMVRGVARGDI